MRKLLVIALLFCLLLNMGGYLLLVHRQQQVLKKEMRLHLRAGLHPEEQENLVLVMTDGRPTDPSFRWEEEKEFHYQGKMYDLISKETINGKLHIRCIEDSKEEHLLKQLTDIQERKEGTPTKSKSILQFLFATLFIRPEISLGLPNTATSVSYYDHYLSSFTTSEKDVISPPPRA